MWGGPQFYLTQVSDVVGGGVCGGGDGPQHLQAGPYLTHARWLVGWWLNFTGPN